MDTKIKIVNSMFKYLKSNGQLHTQKDLAIKLGTYPSNISKALKGDEEYLTESFIDRFNKAFGSIFNDDWLLSGEGTMLKEKQDEVVPILNPNIKMIPLVSQYAQAGYLSGFGDEEYIKTLPKVPIIVDHEIKGEYIAFEVRGDSMDNGTEESLIEGDILIGRKIHIDYWKYKLHINKWNFIIVHKTDGIIVKRIADHNTDACAITAHSLNPLYPDVSYSLNDIDQLFNVVQILRSGRI